LSLQRVAALGRLLTTTTRLAPPLVCARRQPAGLQFPWSATHCQQLAKTAAELKQRVLCGPKRTALIHLYPMGASFLSYQQVTESNTGCEAQTCTGTPSADASDAIKRACTCARQGKDCRPRSCCRARLRAIRCRCVSRSTSAASWMGCFFLYYLLCSRALDHFYMAVCIHCIAMDAPRRPPRRSAGPVPGRRSRCCPCPWSCRAGRPALSCGPMHAAQRSWLIQPSTTYTYDRDVARKLWRSRAERPTGMLSGRMKKDGSLGARAFRRTQGVSGSCFSQLGLLRQDLRIRTLP